MLNSKNTVLVIIDVQGNLARIMQNAEALFQSMAILIQGATVDEVSTHLKGLKPIKKDVFSCGKNDEFNARLSEINPDNVVLSGIETHICIYQTAVDLLKQNFNVEVAADATSTRLKHNKEIGLEKIRRAGGEITSVETFLFEIQGKATGEKFRELVKLVK